MKLFLAIFCLLQSISVVLPQSQLITENDNNKSKVILLGEVVYLGERPINLSTAIHVERQTVVFRVVYVFNGTFDVEYVRIALRISSVGNGLSEEKYKNGNKFILYLKNEECKSGCVDLTSDWEFKVKPEFQKFEKFPCYSEDSQSVVETDDKRIEEAKNLYKNTTKSN